MLVTEAFPPIHSAGNSWHYLAQFLKVQCVKADRQFWRQKSTTNLLDRYRMSNRHFFSFLFNLLQI